MFLFGRRRRNALGQVMVSFILQLYGVIGAVVATCGRFLAILHVAVVGAKAISVTLWLPSLLSPSGFPDGQQGLLLAQLFQGPGQPASAPSQLSLLQ